MDLDLRSWARSDPDKPAIRIDGASTSYGELEAMANRAAHVLRAVGVGHGSHVALMLGNDVEVFALVWGAYRLGAYVTPVPSKASAEDAAYIIGDSDARVLVASAALGANVAALPGLLADAPPTFLSVHGALPGYAEMEPLMRAASATPVAHERSGALMMYTSGTTGKPKGVLRPLPAATTSCPAFAQDLIQLFRFSDASRYLSTAPLYHAAPLRFGLAFLAAGGTVHVMPKFDAAQALDILEREGITHSQWVPTMFRRLLALDPERRRAFHAPRHQLALHAAAPCPIPLKQAMIDWWGPILEEYYAGSESVGLTHITSREWLRRPGSVGQAKKGHLHVLGDNDEELAPGERGRVFFSGVPPFRYHHAPEKTAEKTSRQGWQTFGDVGYVDEDGYLFLTDRMDDMIISGGVNIYPQEVEAALLEMPEVAEAAVVGAPDNDFGERPVAFVVPREAPSEPGALVADIDAFAAARLGRIKRPKEIHLLDSLPTSSQGKLLRRELRRLLEERA